MSTILDRTNEFIAKFNLQDTNEFRESLSDFVTGCWGDHFKIVHGEPIPDDKKSSTKVSKADKIEDPTECKERDDLRNCTAGVLNEFSKKNGLRVGGNKKEIMDRVWRFLQGNNSDEDISPRNNKTKKEKKINEKHDCYGCTSKGTPCAVAATVEVDGCWFCWRHEESAKDIIANKGSSSSVAVVEKTVEKKKPVEKKPVEKKPVEKKPVEKKKSIKKPVPVESESEEEEIDEKEESDEELETDEE